MSDERIVTTWFLNYGDDIYHYLMYQLGTSDVEDIVQEVFIKAFMGYDLYEQKANPKTWLFSIARNVLIDEIRKKKRLKLKAYIMLQEKNNLSKDASPEKAIELTEEYNNLYKAIQSLKTNYREVIILRGIKELSVSETASILAWKESKVRSTYHRAKGALQKVLGGELK